MADFRSKLSANISRIIPNNNDDTPHCPISGTVGRGGPTSCPTQWQPVKGAHYPLIAGGPFGAGVKRDQNAVPRVGGRFYPLGRYELRPSVEAPPLPAPFHLAEPSAIHRGRQNPDRKGPLFNHGAVGLVHPGGYPLEWRIAKRPPSRPPSAVRGQGVGLFVKVSGGQGRFSTRGQVHIKRAPPPGQACI